MLRQRPLIALATSLMRDRTVRDKVQPGAFFEQGLVVGVVRNG